MQSRHWVEEFIAAFNRKDIPGALGLFRRRYLSGRDVRHVQRSRRVEEDARTDVSRS